MASIGQVLIENLLQPGTIAAIGAVVLGVLNHWKIGEAAIKSASAAVNAATASDKADVAAQKTETLIQKTEEIHEKVNGNLSQMKAELKAAHDRIAAMQQLLEKRQ